MQYANALKIAECWVEYLRPACKRIEVKGSICRGKIEPKDIEILAIPDLSPVARKPIEFGKPLPKLHKTFLDVLIAEKKDEGVIHLRADGDKHKKIWLLQDLIQIDLFLVTPPAEWGVLSVIRTGPSEFSHWMVTKKSLGGALPNDYIVADGVVGKRMRGNKGDERSGVIAMPEEIDFFKLCGLDWIEPGQRVARWMR